MNIEFLIAAVRLSAHLRQTVESIDRSATAAGVAVRVTVCGGVSAAEVSTLGCGRFVRLQAAEDGRDRGMLAKFNAGLRAVGTQAVEAPIWIFCNDDLIVNESFVAGLSSLRGAGAGLYGPFIRTPDGRVQYSLCRRRYTKLGLFLRVWDGGFYSKVFGRFLSARPDDSQWLNRGRETVDGCCFIFTGDTIGHLGQFDESFYLYFEEVYLQWLVRRYRLHCAVLPELQVVHLGGDRKSVV